MSRNMPIFLSALMLSGVNLLLRLIGTSFQVYISNRIGPSGVGLLQLVMSVGSLAMVAGMAGIRTGAMYLTAEELGKKRPDRVPYVLSGCFTYSILCSGLIGAALYTAAPYIAANWIGEPRIISSLRLYSAFLPVVCLCGVMTGYFTASNRIGTLAAVEIAEQLVSMGITVTALVKWAGKDPSRACASVIIGSSLGGCFTALCLAFLYCRNTCPPGHPIPVKERLIKTTLPLGIADMVRSGITTVENLTVPKRLMRNPEVSEPLAAFGLVTGMVFPVILFPACILYALAELLIPELARCSAAENSVRIRYLIKRSLKATMVYGLCAGGILFFSSERLCMQLYGSLEAAQELRRYALLIPMLYCDTVTDALTKGLGQQYICVRYNILTSATDVLLLFYLLPIWGMNGYYFSFTLTHLINFALSLRRLLQIAKLQLPWYIPMLAVSAALSCGAVCMYLSNLWLRIGSYTVLLLTCLYLLKILRMEDLRWVTGMLCRGNNVKRPAA